MQVFDLIEPNGAISVFGIRLVGFTLENGRKLLLTLFLVVFLWLVARTARALVSRLLRNDPHSMFWPLQAINLTLSFFLIIGMVSIWFDNPGRLATALGLVSAGLAFALQKVITAVAGYFIILRGRVFNIGDRISMGGIRGDVIALGYTRTTVMEIGQPPSVEMPDPAMWVGARQYTGRVVTVTNDKIFSEPVYNYSREFPFLWEELRVAIPYSAARDKAEGILLETAGRHTVKITELSKEAVEEIARRYFVKTLDLNPKVYYRLTENWLELTVRFVAREYGIRELKDSMSRQILSAFDAAGIRIASATFDIIGLPSIRITNDTTRGRIDS